MFNNLWLFDVILIFYNDFIEGFLLFEYFFGEWYLLLIESLYLVSHCQERVFDVWNKVREELPKRRQVIKLIAWVVMKILTPHLLLCKLIKTLQLIFQLIEEVVVSNIILQLIIKGLAILILPVMILIVNNWFLMRIVYFITFDLLQLLQQGVDLSLLLSYKTL